jgi:hypothetical protein
VDEAARLFLGEMGLAHHQALYALHRDTDNWHLQSGAEPRPSGD